MIFSFFFILTVKCLETYPNLLLAAEVKKYRSQSSHSTNFTAATIKYHYNLCSWSKTFKKIKHWHESVEKTEPDFVLSWFSCQLLPDFPLLAKSPNEQKEVVLTKETAAKARLGIRRSHKHNFWPIKCRIPFHLFPWMFNAPVFRPLQRSEEQNLLLSSAMAARSQGSGVGVRLEPCWWRRCLPPPSSPGRKRQRWRRTPR